MEYSCSKSVEKLLKDNYKKYLRNKGRNARDKLRDVIENILMLSTDMFIFLDIAKKRGRNPHPLKKTKQNDFSGCWGLTIIDGERLVVRPDCDPIPLREDGSVDLKAVLKIYIVEIIDYHPG